MSSSNTVAIVTIIVSSLATGYATYANNQTNKELEQLKQDQLLAMEKLKQIQLLELEKIKSTQEREITTQNRTFEIRTQYCNEAKSLYKELVDAVVTSKDNNIQKSLTASTLTSKLKIQAYAYIDDTIYDNYTKQNKTTVSADDSAMVAALSTQLRRCATMKPSNL